jgi:hypothetical protein
LRLLEVVAEGYALAGEWPVWQYVYLTLERERVDATATYQAVPQWQFYYRPVNGAESVPSVPVLDQRIVVTAIGIAALNGVSVATGGGYGPRIPGILLSLVPAEMSGRSVTNAHAEGTWQRARAPPSIVSSAVSQAS